MKTPTVLRMAAAAAVALAPLSMFTASPAQANICDVYAPGSANANPAEYSSCMTMLKNGCYYEHVAYECQQLGVAAPAEQAPQTTQPPSAAPPTQQPFEPAQPHNGCFVASTTTTSNLLKECPNYTCASVLDDQMREQCMSAVPEAQKAIVNIIGHDNPTALYPTPQTAAGTPPTPPQDDTGPCGSNGLCKSAVGVFIWASGAIGKHEPPETTAPVGCCGIRG